MSGVIYFLSDGVGSIKIGFSRQLNARIKTLSRSSSKPLTLIGSVAGEPRHEGAVHERLGQFRTCGEWFRDCPEVRSVIAMAIRCGWEAAGINPKPTRRRIEGIVAEAKAIADLVLKYAALVDIGPTNRLASIEARYQIPSGTLWNLQYRPAKDMPMSTYIALVSAARRLVEDVRVQFDKDKAATVQAWLDSASDMPDISEIMRHIQALRAARGEAA